MTERSRPWPAQQVLDHLGPTPRRRPVAAGEAFGGPGTGDLVAVALDTGPAGREVAAVLRHLPAVTVGVDHGGALPEVGAGFDVLYTTRAEAPAPWVSTDDPAGDLEVLGRAVRSHPGAAVALVQLLRLGEGLEFGSALAAESATYGMLQGGREFAAWLAGRPGVSSGVTASPSGPSSGAPVLVERRGDILCIELNRPERHNAVNASMRDALVEALDLALSDPEVAGIELSGRGPSFCSGGDLAEFGRLEDPVSAHMTRTRRSPAAWLAALRTALPGPTVARVHGACAGAGLEMAALAERLVAHPATTFWLPEVGMGLVPGAGGTASLPRRLGRHRTAYLALTGLRMGAADALAWGLVDALDDRT